MDFDQTQAIYDFEEEEEEQVKQDKTHAKKKEVAVLKVFTQQGFKETFFPIFLGDNVIGRDGKCNITVPIKALSKKHACIEVQRDLHLIYDCESKNRTKKGKSFLKPTIRYELKHGDMLTFGDVKCQYVVDLDTEEDEGDETGSETGSESMLPEATTEEELDGDEPIVHEDVPIISSAKSSPSGDELQQPVQVSQRTKKPAGEGEEEAYMYAADSDTDDERPLAAAAMLTVLYSSEEEHETPVREKTTKVHVKQKSSVEGQTLAFGLGISPDNVFRNRDSSGSSHAGQTAGSIPQTLMLSSDSDAQSDGKGDQLSSGNRRSSAPKHPEAPHDSGNQPSCEPTFVYESDGESPIKRPTNRKAIVSDPSCQPTLLYGSESDDGSPLKKPRHPEADVSKELDPTCPPTLPCETEDGSPVKKPTYRGVAKVPTVLNESDSEEDTNNAAGDSESNKRIQQVVSSSPAITVRDKRGDNQMQSVSGEAEATVLCAAAEMSSTDDEGEPETNADVEKPTDHIEPTHLLYSTEEAGERKLNDDDNMVADEYGDDCATQPYAMDSDFNTENATIPVVGVDTSDANQTTKLSDLEATQAYYCVEDEKEEEEDSNSSNSQPLPIGPTAEADQGDIAAATLAYGLEATQAYNATEKDDETEDEQDQDDQGAHCNDADPTLAYDLQSTQAYGVSKEDDNTDDEDNDKSESHRERVEGQSREFETKVDGRDAVQATIPDGLESTQAYGVGEGDNTDDEDDDKNENYRERVEGQSCELETKVNGGDAVQATMPYGLELTQAYGADETDDEDSKDLDMADSRGDESRGDGVALASGLAETLAYGGHDDVDNEDKDDENENKKVDEHMRQENQATLAYGLEETQAYDAESNDTDSASYSAIEATQAYGIEEPFEAEVQTKPKKDTVKKMTTKRVAFAGSFSDEKDDETSASETGKQNQPSTSSAADMEEEFQESEDFIQPRSRSRRGRKKLVIEESQEDESQQTSERSSSSKGKSNTKGNEQSQVKNAVLDSTSDTSKQIQATYEGLEDETPATTAASRKGWRRAMRVTIEADESDEEDISQGSSKKRGSRAKKAVQEVQEESNKNGHSSTAGRKRRRQAAKVTVEESDVEVKETPAPKSRRGRKERADQSEAVAVSVSETPRRTIDTPDAANPQGSTAADVESTNTRRGRRGRGRKGTAATVQETPQKTDSITLEASVTYSTKIRSQASVAPLARGKGRGRGKKTQSLSTEMEIPGATSAIDEEEQHASESPAVSAASKGRGRGRQGRGKRTQPSRSIALESSEYVSQTLSTPESSEGSQTRKARGRGKIASEQEPSPDVEVAETPAKKSRRGKEPTVAHSPSLQQGKQAAESNPRVIFTGLTDKQGEKVVTSLGGELVNNIHDCTHLVTYKVRRTVKFLCGLASGQIIVLPSWLDACKKAKCFVDTTPFLVKDEEAEKQYKFDLRRSHEAALNQGLLDGYKVHVTKKVLPDPSQMKDIIQSAKGEFLSSMPRGKEDNVFVISCKEDRSVCKRPLEAGIPVVSAEVLLTGILRQELHLEEFKLFEDEVSDTSQNTTSSSGTNKRRREQSETATPPSAAEKKSSGSKRRKK